MKLPNKLQNAWYSNILQEIAQLFFEDKRIHAFWVEGSIAQGRSDEYSDLDLWASIDNDSETEMFAKVEKLLRSHDKLDINYLMQISHPEIFHTVYHIEGKNEFQTIDLNLQHKSRVITLDKDVDDNLIIFDKAEIVRTLITKPKDIDWTVTMERVRQYYSLMHPNVIKNIKRGRPLEAKIYYDYLIQYLVKTIRKLHSPNKIDYGLKHSYHELPNEYLDFLQGIAFIKNEEEMLEGLDKMKQFIDKFELIVSVPDTNRSLN